MMPVVAIIGRPNVGKSTLFNRICGHKKAIVDDTPGLTRDRLYEEVDWRGHHFILVDTGGLEPSTEDLLLAQMREQTEFAIDEADMVIFMMDAQQGITPSDKEIAQRLRNTQKTTFFVANKVDGPRHDPLVLEFYELGVDKIYAISARHGRGVDELMEDLISCLPHHKEEVKRADQDVIRVAVVGRPNVGKSSLINRLCGRQRLVVAPSPGTTTDSVDTEIKWYGQKFILVDTAGIRRKSKITFDLERYCAIRALRSIDRCDVAVLLLDATEGVTAQDERIGRYIIDRGKGCVVVANKWDLVTREIPNTQSYLEHLQSQLKHLSFAPFLTVSAKTGRRISQILQEVKKVYETSSRRVPTAQLNRALQRWIEAHPPPLHRKRPVKLYYASQVEVRPPTFVVFCNKPEGIQESYKRYLINQIRSEFDFHGTPVRLHLRPKE
jgi:GTP-binding protein